MTHGTKVKLAVIGDLLVLALIAVFVPWLWVKLGLMLIVAADLYYGLKRFGNWTNHEHVEDYTDDYGA